MESDPEERSLAIATGAAVQSPMDSQVSFLRNEIDSERECVSRSSPEQLPPAGESDDLHSGSSHNSQRAEPIDLGIPEECGELFGTVSPQKGAELKRTPQNPALHKNRTRD
jgi:hypothetical protein